VDIGHVAELMQTMKLGVAVSPMPETQTLFVTCYANRMPRIEQLIHIVDRPGRSREFRFRQLQHTLAQTLAAKIQALAVEIQDITITMGTTAQRATQTRPIAGAHVSGSPESPTRAVYLDTDERTNRLLMIGAAAQLDLVEQLIDILDVTQPDRHTLRVYALKHLGAQDAAEQLTRLGILGDIRTQTKPSREIPARIAAGDHPEHWTQVAVIEATNSLLVLATREQHQRVQSVLPYLDVTCRDLRSLHVYTLKNMEAQEVLEKLHAMGIPESDHLTTPSPAASAPEKPILQTPPHIAILEATNALLVNATAGHHREIATLIGLIDVQTQKEAIPYEIYFLENQSPEHLAEVLNRIARETLVSAEDKVTGKQRRDTSDPIVIVPDELTFSLIVYANRKNQEWIRVLVEQLDRQQSQVLIDVTLVEISKTDEFNLDLNLITGIPDMAAASGLMEPLAGTVTTQDIMNKLHTSGRNRFMDLQSNAGRGNAFYGDEQVMLLINAMDEKKYGRVLAKPKVLVNDNETGTITTKDTTYVKETKQSVLPGNSEAVITSEEFTPYEAGITLEIVPHINEDDLLRLNITMTRSDFIAADGDKPPDQSSSDVTTVVTIPDGSTIILGGMLKMNQTKGRTKVPGLGDVPILGGLFRGSHRTDLQTRLYIFVKAEIIRPAEALADREGDLGRLSDQNRAAFEAMEKRFQDVQLWPGVESGVTDPCQVLETR
jgi:type II secretory pathway component GspD/PulD (secretin)